jgi:hypothetical protein
MRAELTIAKNGKVVAVIKGARAWIESRAIAYRVAGFDVVISILERF